jgi:SBP domain
VQDTLFNVDLEPEESPLSAVSAPVLPQPLLGDNLCQIYVPPTASSSAACTHPAPGSSDGRRLLGRVGNAQRAAQTPCKCRVPGCESILATVHVGEGNTATAASYYSRRLRVCYHHRKAALVPWPDGEPKRWCQVRMPQLLLASFSVCHPGCFVSANVPQLPRSPEMRPL